MDKKDFDRLKEKEKEHLRKVRELKRRLRSAQGALRAKEALRALEQASDMSELDAAVQAVSGEVLDAEVRLDMAMESARGGPADTALTPEELRRQKADDLVAQMKAALIPKASGDSTARGARTPEDEPAPDADSLPDKTIGKIKPEAEEEGSSTPPDKTIGRMTSSVNREDPPEPN